MDKNTRTGRDTKQHGTPEGGSLTSYKRVKEHISFGSCGAATKLDSDNESWLQMHETQLALAGEKSSTNAARCFVICEGRLYHLSCYPTRSAHS